MTSVKSPLPSLQSAAFDREEGGTVLRCVSAKAIAQIAVANGLSNREVSALALDNGLVPLRYVKNMGTLAAGGQARLLRSRALVVGAGGIGGSVVELLARTGVGTVVVIDPDVFDETNLNRQNFCCTDVIGEAKVDIAADRVRYINGDVEVVRHRLAATAENLAELIDGAHVVIDALDSIDDRLVLQEACSDAGVVMVHGAIAGTAVQATTIYPGGVGLAGFAPIENAEGKSRGIETETGNPATTPMLCAAIQVQEAVKVILGKSDTLKDRMLFLDMEDWAIDFIDL